MNEEKLSKIKEKIQPYFKDVGGHGFDHTERVYNLAMRLAKDEAVDLKILRLACLFHDIARMKEEDGYDDHAEEGAKIAEKMLRQENIPIGDIEHIKDCIMTHRCSRNIRPKTEEAKILQDADRLDALGAISIARVFMYNGLHKTPLYIPRLKPVKEYHGQATTAINHFYEKILRLKPETFNTEQARRIAGQRYNFVVAFLEEFKAEWEGVR